MKIGIYTIAKNELSNVRAWFDNARGADSITFVDTGSNDGTRFLATKESALHSGARIHQVCIDPWRFDYGHNVALALMPADIDIAIPLHLDERLCDGWREMIEAKWAVGVCTKIRYTYEHSPGHSFTQDRIHARRGYIWRYPRHEACVPSDPAMNEIFVNIPELVIKQTQHDNQHRRETLQGLLAASLEYPNDPRMMFYLARELFYYGRWRDSINLFTSYLGMNIDHPVERAQACEHMAVCFRNLAREKGFK